MFVTNRLPLSTSGEGRHHSRQLQPGAAVQRPGAAVPEGAGSATARPGHHLPEAAVARPQRLQRAELRSQAARSGQDVSGVIQPAPETAAHTAAASGRGGINLT